MLAPIFHHQARAIVPSFPWKPIFRALDPWLCPFSTPSHSCLKRHEKAHNEHNATLSTLTTLHWCFIIQVKKMKSCHILFSPRYHHSEPDIVKTLAMVGHQPNHRHSCTTNLSLPFSVENHSYQLVLTLPTECWVPKAQLAFAIVLKRLAVNNSLCKQDPKDWYVKD